MQRTFNDTKQDDSIRDITKYQQSYNHEELGNVLLIKMRPNDTIIENNNNDHETDDEAIVISQRRRNKGLTINPQSVFSHNDNDSELGDYTQPHTHLTNTGFIFTPGNMTDGNPIEEEINQIIRDNEIKVPLIKLNKNTYLFGTELITPFMNGNNCVIKVPDGFVDL